MIPSLFLSMIIYLTVNMINSQGQSIFIFVFVYLFIFYLYICLSRDLHVDVHFI